MHGALPGALVRCAALCGLRRDRTCVYTAKGSSDRMGAAEWLAEGLWPGPEGGARGATRPAALGTQEALCASGMVA